MRRGLKSNLIVAMTISTMGSVCAAAQPDYGFEWATIGDPGNRPANKTEAPHLFPPWNVTPMLVGDVGYEYRITRNEASVAQQFEFIQAYAPFYKGNLRDFNTFYIRHMGDGEFWVNPDALNRPATLAWHMAATYTNWLHNDKVNEGWAFENGAYDISTFTQNPDGSWNDQAKHHPDAKFWIPTMDEALKALNWDPDKDGVGGYYFYPHGSDEPPIPGWPWEGGETAAGIPLNIKGPWLDIGSYPDVQSPWGLLDGSGGEMEMLEDMVRGRRTRFAKGTWQFFPSPEWNDRLDNLFTTTLGNTSQIGFRVASTIPGPPTFSVAIVFTLAFRRRRR